ncbi:MAG: phage tail protein [Chloroflexi bacterium]|nr:phage tail protein [Chloroflexota bacterium]
MPRTGDPIEVHASFRFTVSIDKVTHAAFTECNLPSLQVETQSLNEGGQNAYAHTLPIRVKAGTVTLKHGITKDGALLKWYLQVLRGEKLKDVWRTVTITMYDSMLNAISTWTFQRAYPVKWGGPQLRSGDQALAIEELEIAHHGFEVS